MGFTLQVQDPLADELRQQASDEHISVEELAHRLMRDALRERTATLQWSSQNRRRLELIARRLKTPLTAEEEMEFQQLQTLACERAAPFDGLLLQTVASLRREVEQLPEEPCP